MIQLIASDMDGTLLNGEMEISEANITAIKKKHKSLEKEEKAGKEDVQLNVNDEDLYQDANQKREEQEEEQQRPKGRGR